MKTLHLPWHLCDLTLPPQQWFDWPPDETYVDQDRSTQESDIEALLGFPKYTIRILDTAFSLGLSRDCGWRAHDECTHLDAFYCAAKLYKRGVATLPIDPKSSPSKKGIVIIKIFPFEEILQSHHITNHCFVLTEQTLLRAWPHLEDIPHRALENFREDSKTFEGLCKIVSEWRQSHCLTHWMIIGGGSLLDVASLACGLLGCSFTCVPTTLLSMIDAGVGGKAAINYHPYGKNQLGLYAFPNEMWIFPSWLQTLPDRDLWSGGSECLKHAFLKFEPKRIKLLSQALGEKNLTTIHHFMESLIQVKLDIVTQDPTEQHVRMILNLGHTLAHALESMSYKDSYKDVCKDCDDIRPIHHGEAVGLGLLFSALLSHYEGFLKAKDCAFIFDRLREAHALISYEKLESFLGKPLHMDSTIHEILALIKHDKKQSLKQEEGTTQWILLENIGQVKHKKMNTNKFLVPVKEDTLRKVWLEFLKVISNYKIF